MRSYLLVVGLLGLIVVGGCKNLTGATVPKIGKPGPVTQLGGGISMQEVTFDSTHRLWVYTKTGMVKGKQPCIVIAAAGSHLFDGKKLAPGDQPEHLPYVKAGFVVVAYDVTGEVVGQSDQAVISAAQQFKEAKAGSDDGKRAIDYAISNVPQVDPKRIAAVGHSSAGTLALALAENDSHVKACIAYAPVVDVVGFLQSNGSLEKLNRAVPGLQSCLSHFSPMEGKANLKCPVMLFHAQDDANVSGEPLATFAKQIMATSPKSEFLQVTSGGHYESMLNLGIPAGLAFLKKVL